MAIDTPATIAIIGAGPVGLEAALYARFLGYDVRVFERGIVGENLRNTSAQDVRLPAGRCCSPLGVRALSAQDPTWEPPALDTPWTPRELVENYLAPLATTDLLDGHIAVGSAVLSICRIAEPAEGENAADGAHDEPEVDEELDDAEYEYEAPRLPPLRVTVQAGDGAQTAFDADIVIDASGSSGGEDFLAELNLRRCPTAGQPQTCGDAASHGAAADLVLSEPNFYILGSKSRSGTTGFEIIDGLRQIRNLFGLVGGRAGLDLYQQ